MQFWLTLIGGIAGTVAAVAIHYLFRFLRRRIAEYVAAVGWLITILVVATTAGMTLLYFKSPDDLMSPLWGVIAVVLTALLLLCSSIGILHRRYFSLPWYDTFGVLMTEMGTAALTVVVLHITFPLYEVADIIRGGSREIPEILRSYAQTRHILEWFDIALIVALLLLELLNHRRSPISPTENPALG